MDNEYLLPQLASEVEQAIRKALSSVQTVNGAKPDKDGNVSITLKVVLDNTQELTLEEQEQAREKIGAAGVDSGVGTLHVTDDGEGNVVLENVPTTDDDQIVESGTSNGWDYIKLKSGYAKCSRTATATVKTTDWKDSGMMSFPLLADFGLFWTKEMVNGKDIQFSYPFPFVEHPSEVACMTNGTVWFPLQLISTSSGSREKTDSYRLCTYKVPDKDIKVTLSFNVAGRWKEGGSI